MRSLPFDANTQVPFESQADPELERLTRSFNPNMQSQNVTSLPGLSFTFNKGNSFEKEKYNVGYNAILNYSNTYDFFPEFVRNNYLKPTDSNEYNLFLDESIKGSLGRQTVRWSALGTTSFEWDKLTLSANLMRNQSGESAANTRLRENKNQTGATLAEQVLTYPL